MKQCVTICNIVSIHPSEPSDLRAPGCKLNPGR